MTMFAESGREANGERHVPEATAFRCRHVALPLGSLDADLPFPEIHVAPLQCHHFTASKSGLSAEQHDQERVGFGCGSVHQLFVLLEIVEPH